MREHAVPVVRSSRIELVIAWRGERGRGRSGLEIEARRREEMRDACMCD